MALGLRHQGLSNRVFTLLSDGELDEGATWKAAMAAAHHRLVRLTAVVDMNALQADGPTADVLRIEPVLEKWQAFGWHAIRVDGNDPAALLAAFDEAASTDDQTPAVVICDTRIGRESRCSRRAKKAHFMRVEEDEWKLCREQLEKGAAR